MFCRDMAFMDDFIFWFFYLYVMLKDEWTEFNCSRSMLVLQLYLAHRLFEMGFQENKGPYPSFLSLNVFPCPMKAPSPGTEVVTAVRWLAQIPCSHCGWFPPSHHRCHVRRMWNCYEKQSMPWGKPHSSFTLETKVVVKSLSTLTFSLM